MHATTTSQFFLVAIQIQRPLGSPDIEWDALLALEAERGRELIALGLIRGIWRVPGKSANRGIWAAASHDELHAAISSLPLFRFMEIEITPLSTHPLGDFVAGPAEAPAGDCSPTRTASRGSD